MKTVNKWVDHIATAFVALILLLVCIQVLFRYVLHMSVPWTEEISRLLFVYLAFLGGAIALREGALIVVDTIPNLIQGRAKAILNVLIYFFSLAFVILMFVASFNMMNSVWDTTLSTVSWISNGWIYFAQVISFGLMILYSISPLLKNLLAVIKGGDRA